MIPGLATPGAADRRSWGWGVGLFPRPKSKPWDVEILRDVHGDLSVAKFSQWWMSAEVYSSWVPSVQLSG